MKKLSIEILSILLSIFMIGCNSQKNNNSSETAKTTTEITTKETTTTTSILPIEYVEIEKDLLEKTIMDDDGNDLIDASYEIPVIKNETGNIAIKKINDYFKTKSDDWFAEFGTQPIDLAKEWKNIDPENFIAHTYNVKFEVAYNNYGVLSILQCIYTNVGGVHPSSERCSETFDLDTGEIMDITNILNGTEEEINNMIFDSFFAIIDESSESYYEDAKEIISNSELYSGFYLSDSAVCFFYQPEILAPYAAGYPEIKIDYTDTEKFKIKLI